MELEKKLRNSDIEVLYDESTVLTLYLPLSVNGNQLFGMIKEESLFKEE
jgi:hypothetical protein